MDNQQEMMLRLWDYIDGSSAEQNTIEKLIAENIEWRQQYNELLGLNTILASSDLEEPSLRFSKNVMEEVVKYHIAPAAKQYLNNKVIWGVAGLFITMLVGFVSYALTQGGWSTASEKSTFGESVKAIDYSAFTNSTFLGIFMLVNVVLGLMFLDRYLAQKSNTSKGV
ncbi:MAG: hypothetical protein JWP88_1040 [Flaviaesturariibacter sp.]|nr:hypothetical protein [Flaviaesturariibacter sp.]